MRVDQLLDTGMLTTCEPQELLEFCMALTLSGEQYHCCITRALIRLVVKLQLAMFFGSLPKALG